VLSLIILPPVFVTPFCQATLTFVKTKILFDAELGVMLTLKPVTSVNVVDVND